MRHVRAVLWFFVGVLIALYGVSANAQTSVYGVDEETILYVYAWGMGAVLSMWALGFALGCALKAIKSA